MFLSHLESDAYMHDAYLRSLRTGFLDGKQRLNLLQVHWNATSLGQTRRCFYDLSEMIETKYNVSEDRVDH